MFVCALRLLMLVKPYAACVRSFDRLLGFGFGFVLMKRFQLFRLNTITEIYDSYISKQFLGKTQS